MIILLSIAISRPVSGECLRAQHTTIMYIQSATDPISLMLAAAFPRSDSLHKLFSVPIRREHLCVLSRPGFCVWRKHANNTRPNSTHTTKIVVGRLNYLLFWAGRQIARLASLNNRKTTATLSQEQSQSCLLLLCCCSTIQLQNGTFFQPSVSCLRVVCVNLFLYIVGVPALSLESLDGWR